MPVREAAALHQLELASRRRARSTRRFYELAIDRYLSFCHETGRLNGCVPTLDLFTAVNVRSFTVWLRAQSYENHLTHTIKPIGDKAVREYVSALKSFVHFLVREEVLDRDPLRNVALPEATEPLIEEFTVEECLAMLRVIDGQMLAERNRAIFYFLLDTGVRADEIARLTRESVDLSGSARIFGKGAKWRRVEFGKTTARVLARYLINRGKVEPVERVFMTREGGAMTRQSVYQIVHEWGEIAGIHAFPHRFRHTFAVLYLVAHPGALFHLQELLGHESLEMVRRYARRARQLERLPGPSPVEILLRPG